MAGKEIIINITEAPITSLLLNYVPENKEIPAHIMVSAAYNEVQDTGEIYINGSMGIAISDEYAMLLMQGWNDAQKQVTAAIIPG